MPAKRKIHYQSPRSDIVLNVLKIHIIPIAAIVLELGVLMQSPIPYILEYLVWRKVLGSTDKNPTSFVNEGCFFKTSGGPIGGHT